MQLVTVEQHHEVLPAWAAFRRRLGRSPVVLTLDHHTDILPCPRALSAEPELALPHLRHDQHLDYALRHDLIAESWVIAHENFTAPAHPAMHVIVDPAWPEPGELLNHPEPYRALADRVLETEFLTRQLPEGWLGDRPLILDIDLDYFLTLRGASPRDAGLIRELAGRAGLVTVSMERDWVRLLRFPNETMTAELLHERLLQTLN